MDWASVAYAAVIGLTYVVGKRSGLRLGRAQGMSARLTPLCLTVEMGGDVIGAVHLDGIRMGHDRPDDDAPAPTDGPPPGHPEAL